jgi:Ser/Thr protein kinase RdoA (MazF antagonist)
MDDSVPSIVQTHLVLHIPRPGRLISSVKTRVRAPEIEPDIVYHILNHYGLELTGSIRNLTVNKRNRNIIVETSSGRKVLKRYWQGWPDSVIVYEHSILQRLAETNFPAPRLCKTRDGATYFNRLGQNYAIFDYQDGSNYSTNYLFRAHRLNLMARAGHTLANLHRQLDGFTPEGQHHSGFRSYSEDRWRDLTWHMKKVAELKEKSRLLKGPEEKIHADWLIQKSDYVIEELSRLDETLNKTPLRRLIIHGDYGLHNLHFHKDGTVTPLDFESARLEWQLRDLVNCLGRFRFSEGEFDITSIRYFLASYQIAYPLQVGEWRLFPQVWRFCKLQDVVKYWNSYFETEGPVRKLVSARKALKQADLDRRRLTIITELLEKR